MRSIVLQLNSVVFNLSPCVTCRACAGFTAAASGLLLLRLARYVLSLESGAASENNLGCQASYSNLLLRFPWKRQRNSFDDFFSALVGTKSDKKGCYTSGVFYCRKGGKALVLSLVLI